MDHWVQPVLTMTGGTHLVICTPWILGWAIHPSDRQPSPPHKKKVGAFFLITNKYHYPSPHFSSSEELWDMKRDSWRKHEKEQSKIRCCEEGCAPWNEIDQNDIIVFFGDFSGLARWAADVILHCAGARYLFSNNPTAEWNIKVRGLVCILPDLFSLYLACWKQPW